ncbi:MAG: endo-1,4-beta-xylanase [Terrimicrobiaceae bacterium]
MKLTPFDDPNSYRNLWENPEIENRIAGGIEAHRKGDAVIRVLGEGGKPAPGVEVRVRQSGSSFRFGANIFKLAGYESEDLNRAYEEAYLGLFNAATVPFYWKDLEPAPDRLRFAADSEPIPRRPPPDLVVDFCRRHGLRTHGHTLVWEYLKWSMPAWLPRDRAETERLIEKRIREIAERYGDAIKSWDVLNEAVAGYGVGDIHPMPENYEGKAFTFASRYFPKDVRFDINETTGYWYPHKRRYGNLIRRLLDEGAAVGGIGLQFHLFSDLDMARLTLGELFPPANLFEALDLYGAFGLPIHISEITLTAPGNTEDGLAAQADAARNFYRLWFSHPAVEGISWWNVPDGGAAPGEDTVFSGLLFGDLTPKPAYHALRRLLHEEWRTNVSGTTDADGRFAFRGFHGDYAVEAAGRAGETLQLRPGSPGDLVVKL